MAQEVWAAYVARYGLAPKSSTQLMNFSKKTEGLPTLTFSTAKDAIASGGVKTRPTRVASAPCLPMPPQTSAADTREEVHARYLRHLKSMRVPSKDLPSIADKSSTRSSSLSKVTVNLSPAKTIRAALESEEKSEELASHYSVEDWARKQQVGARVLAAITGDGLSLRSLALMTGPEISEFCARHGLETAADKKELAKALIRVPKLWLSAIASECDKARDALDHFGKLESGLTHAHEDCVKEIKAQMTEARTKLAARERALIAEAAKGRDTKLSELKKEELRFRDYVLRLSKAMRTQKSVVENEQLSCVEKESRLKKLLDSTIDGRFDDTIGVNAKLLLDTTQPKGGDGSSLAGLSLVDVLFAIDTCERPSPPQPGGSELVAANAAEIWWQKDVNSSAKIDSFEVEYTRPENTTWNTLSVTRADADAGERFAVVLTHLRHDCRYFVRIKAQNQYGTSSNSRTVIVKTQPSPAPMAPEITSTESTRGGLVLEWSMPLPDVRKSSDEALKTLEGRGKMVRAVTLKDAVAADSAAIAGLSDLAMRAVRAGVSHYQVQWRQKGRESWRSSVAASKEGMRHTISKVKLGRVYEVRVRARNAADWSLWSGSREVALKLSGPQLIGASVADHRAHYSRSYHPSNLLKDDNSNYASAMNGDFDTDECDWVVFDCGAEYRRLTLIALRQWDDGSDVSQLKVEVTDDLVRGAWFTARPSTVRPTKTEDMQTFELGGVEANFRYIRVLFEENHGDREPRARRFVINFLQFHGIPA